MTSEWVYVDAKTFDALKGHLRAMVGCFSLGETFCQFCSSNLVIHRHRADCSYVAAKDFLNKLDASHQETAEG